MNQQRLTDELVEATVNKIFADYHLWGNLYKRGINTKEESYQRMEISIHESFWKLIRENNLKLCLSEANFPYFCKEFENHVKGDTSDNQDHISWLYDVAEEKCEASLNDQRLFFDLMEKLRLTSDYFEPLPENIPSFDVYQIHQYAFEGIYSTNFNCIDDGGLLEDETPIGKTFRIKNELGLNAVVTIEKKDSKYHETSTRTPVEFTATGYIEGYTAIERTCNPEITIWIGKDKRLPWHLTFWMNGNDSNARSQYPLWQEFLQCCNAKGEKQHSILFPVFDEYMGIKD